jgi:hypothetical protein
VNHTDRSPAPGGSCISAAEATIFLCSLSVVLSLRHALPIVYIPEQASVTAVRDDVIYNFSRIDHIAVLAEVIHCKWMRAEIGGCSLAPSGCIQLVILRVTALLQASSFSATSITIAGNYKNAATDALAGPLRCERQLKPSLNQLILSMIAIDRSDTFGEIVTSRHNARLQLSIFH